VDNSTNLKLPYIAAAQALKHITHNEAIRALDAIVQLAVLDRDLTAPPASPGDGERYIVAGSASGAWAGNDNQIAAYQDNAWIFYAPLEGWLAWVADEDQLYAFSGTVWTKVSDSDLQNIAMLGVNAIADATNRLSLSAPATLFNHEGAGHQVKVNKNTAGDNASFLFQTNWSGRAEFGTTGDDDWHVKVSADGSAWNEALIADKTSGAVRFPAGLEHSTTRAPLAGLIHTSGGSGQNSIWRSDLARGPIPRDAIISSLAADVITLTTTTAEAFFNDTYMKGVSYVQIWNMTKNPIESAWVKASAANNQLQVVSAASISGWLATETIRLGDPNTALSVFAVDISPMMQQYFGSVFRQSGVMCKQGISMSLNVSGRIGISTAGVGGSLMDQYSFPAGSFNIGMVIVASSVLSPVSNSNLVYILEGGGGATDTGTGLVSVFGIFA